MQTYYYAIASQKYMLEDEPTEESIRERIRHYKDLGKEIDFWLVRQPAFLNAPELADLKAKVPQPAVAILSTDKTFITWVKLRLEYVATGEFQAPSATIPDPLASLTPV